MQISQLEKKYKFPRFYSNFNKQKGFTSASTHLSKKVLLLLFVFFKFVYSFNTIHLYFCQTSKIKLDSFLGKLIHWEKVRFNNVQVALIPQSKPTCQVLMHEHRRYQLSSFIYIFCYRFMECVKTLDCTKTSLIFILFIWWAATPMYLFSIGDKGWRKSVINGSFARFLQ